jgi:anti-anti-sigma factor
MTPFEITKDEGPRACVVRLSGDIDMAVVPELHTALDEVLESGYSNVVLDLAQVDYADSSALGLLVWLDHRLRPVGGRLVLAGAQRDVARILELSGLVTVAASIAMSANVPAALEGLDLPAVPGDLLWRRGLELSADVNQLSVIREQVCDIVEPLGFPESALFDIKVALGEALANAMRHGAPKGAEGAVRISVSAYSDRVVIEVMDNGSGFDGTHSGSGDLYAPSGRGIMFMKALMDRVEFDSSPLGGTLVRLTKHRAGVL